MTKRKSSALCLFILALAISISVQVGPGFVLLLRRIFFLDRDSGWTVAV